MTTIVSVDAHAGWPVLVGLRYGEPGSAPSYVTERIEPHTKRDFALHSGLSIIHIEEVTSAGSAPKPVIAGSDGTDGA